MFILYRTYRERQEWKYTIIWSRAVEALFQLSARLNHLYNEQFRTIGDIIKSRLVVTEWQMSMKQINVFNRIVHETRLMQPMKQFFKNCLKQRRWANIKHNSLVRREPAKWQPKVCQDSDYARWFRRFLQTELNEENMQCLFQIRVLSD